MRSKMKLAIQSAITRPIGHKTKDYEYLNCRRLTHDKLKYLLDQISIKQSKTKGLPVVDGCISFTEQWSEWQTLDSKIEVIRFAICFIVPDELQLTNDQLEEMLNHESYERQNRNDTMLKSQPSQTH